MLWRIQTGDGGWLYLLVLLEFQSTVDRRMALRMMDYTVRVLLGLGKDDLGPGGGYPPILPIVVYNGERHWNAPTDIRDLFAPVPGELLGYLPRHRYLLVEIATEEERKMTTLIERARKWGEERDQKWLEKGIEQGIERGRVEGERELVYRLVTRRFGPDTAAQLLALLNQISDPGAIAAVADAVIESETAEEFLARVKEA